MTPPCSASDRHVRDDRRYVQSPFLLQRRTAAEILVRRPGHGVSRLRGTAVELWECLRVPVTIADLGYALGARFGGDPAMIEADVRTALEALVADGLVDAT